MFADFIRLNRASLSSYEAFLTKTRGFLIIISFHAPAQWLPRACFKASDF